MTGVVELNSRVILLLGALRTACWRTPGPESVTGTETSVPFLLNIPFPTARTGWEAVVSLSGADESDEESVVLIGVRRVRTPGTAVGLAVALTVVLVVTYP